MSYSDEAVKAKLSSLNESQDSIVTVAQWIMFHRRHAAITASLWQSRLLSSPSPSKRLNLIYLANEVVQQSRARGKLEFLNAFEPLIADATVAAYDKSSMEVQGKLRRVAEVWRQRNIFAVPVLDALEGRLTEMDKARGGGSNGAAGGKGRLGGSLFGGSGSVPSELDGVSKAFTALGKAEASARSAVATAGSEYDKSSDPTVPVPSPPVHAARLSALVRSLAAAQGAVESSIQTRKEVLAGLEKLLETHHAKLAEDEITAADMAAKKEAMENKKREVEDGIMRGLSNPSSPTGTTPGPALNDNLTSDFARNGAGSTEAPETEDFTPPPPDVEAFTPPPGHQADDLTLTGDPLPFTGDNDLLVQTFTTITGAENFHETSPNFDEPAPAFEPPPAMSSLTAADQADDFLNSLAMPNNANGKIRPASSELIPEGMNGGGDVTGDPRLKRRKMSHARKSDADEEAFGAIGADGGNGVDDDEIGALLE